MRAAYIYSLFGRGFLSLFKQTNLLSFFFNSPSQQKSTSNKKGAEKSLPFAWLLMEVELFEPLPGQQVENVPKASKVAMCQLLRFPTKTWPALVRDHGG